MESNNNTSGEVNEKKQKGIILLKYGLIIVFTLLFLGVGWIPYGFSSENQLPLNKTAKSKNVSSAKKIKQRVIHPNAGISSSYRVPVGVTFVEACIKPMDFEINKRFWGWRPNDIINITDNINNFQLGVLEVTRRTAVQLAEHLSRTGATDAYEPSLEFAMNSFMIKPTEYYFPSAESTYQEGLEAFKKYSELIKNKEAVFYSRVDNFVPLLKSYESILGSCNENLVKQCGEISYFKADDYVYYTRGVVSAMGTILKAASKDFSDTVASVKGMDLLNDAILALDQASDINPLIVLEGSPDGLCANHRANMAAPIGLARFYLEVLDSALTGNL